jgi:hypothetical protein
MEVDARRRPVRWLVLLLAAIALQGCTHGAAPTSASQPGASAAGTTASRTTAASGPTLAPDVKIVGVYRLHCNSDGASNGLAIKVRIAGHGGELLSAGAYSLSDRAPLVASDFRPSSDSWDSMIYLKPLGDLQATVSAGRVDATFGVSSVAEKVGIGSGTIRVVVPVAGATTCL